MDYSIVLLFLCCCLIMQSQILLWRCQVAFPTPYHLSVDLMLLWPVLWSWVQQWMFEWLSAQHCLLQRDLWPLAPHSQFWEAVLITPLPSWSPHLGGVTLEPMPVQLLPVYHLTHTSVTAALYVIRSESQPVRCLQPCSHDVLIIIAYMNSSGVYLALRGVHITNNSNINIRNIGQSSDNPSSALQCITDNLRCCRGDPRLGEWYQPNGALVQGTTSTTAFYRSRGDNGNVSLNRPSDVESPTGLFCCEVPDAASNNQTLCVNIGMPTNN